MPKDPLCPLGFHPQVNWPTRCKRCFRKYEEHSVKKEEPPERLSFIKSDKNENESKNEAPKDYSSPYSSISPTALNRLAKIRVEDPNKKITEFQGSDSKLAPPDFGAPLRRNTTDLSALLSSKIEESSKELKNSVSFDSSNNSNSNYLSPTEASFTLKLKKSNSFTEESSSTSPSPPPRSKTPSPVPTFKISTHEPTSKNNQKNLSNEEEGGEDGEAPFASTKKKTVKKKKRLLISGVEEAPPPDSYDSPNNSDPQTPSADVAFIIQVKSRRKAVGEEDDDTMTSGTETTDTTLIDVSEENNMGPNSKKLNLWEFEELQKEIRRLRDRCERVEREKGEILARRVASLEAPKAQSTEYLKLQEKVSHLMSRNEELVSMKKSLETRSRELEVELSSRPTGDFFTRSISELRSKLASKEAEIEELREEKREKEERMAEMESEWEEIQDSFQDLSASSDSFMALKKELEESNKSCRLLQFKLRRTEKKLEGVEIVKKELETQVEATKNGPRVAELEEELRNSKVQVERLEKELGRVRKEPQLSPRLAMKKKSPVLTKAPSGESVDPPLSADVDPSQLLRDLQSTIERESDLREQLKFAEEEVTNLRQKMGRIEDENESLLIQIKKISSSKLPPLVKKGATKSNGVLLNTSDSDSSSDLRLQIELNEQESKIQRRKVEELERKNNDLGKEILHLQDQMEKMRSEASLSVTKSKNVDEVSVLRRKIIEKEREVERLETELQSAKKLKTNRAKSVEVEDSKSEVKKLTEELSKSRTEVKSLEEEVDKYKNSLEEAQSRLISISDSNKTLVSHIEKFKKDIGLMKEHYEAIQDDFALKNSNLITHKENLEKKLSILEKELVTTNNELRALRETFNTRQDSWIKEKLQLQDKLKEAEDKNSRSIPSSNPSLKNIVKDQTIELESSRKEILSYKDQIVFMQKENDELKRQLEDFEKVSQAQIRTISNEPSVKSDKEIKAIRERLLIEEKSHKNELALMKMRHEQSLASKTEELSTLQSQLSRAKRERDTFKTMVDSAQRAISELKSRDSTNLNRRGSISGLEEAATGARAAAAALQERVESLEESLIESRKETSRAMTQLATETASWELTLGQLQQKVNELEEEKLLSSGRSGKVGGQKSRLEIAWQREREEGQRRLREATTLARDLKSTLQEMERERERDKAENRRRLEHLKLSLEEEGEELKRRVGQSQADLLELRDAHAKLRTANEKLRRDREKLEKEQEMSLKRELEGRRLNFEVDKILNELSKKLSTPSSSSSEIGELMRKLTSLLETKNDERERKRSSFRTRGSSGEGEELRNSNNWNNSKSNPNLIIAQQQSTNLTVSSSAYGKEQYGLSSGAVSKSAVAYTSSHLTLPHSRPSRSSAPSPSPSPRGKSLDKTGFKTMVESGLNSNKRSLSLEQSIEGEDRGIWKGEGERGSGSSIDSKGSSIDRFSTMSSKSEKPKKKGLVSRIKKLVRTRSSEESPKSRESTPKRESTQRPLMPTQQF